MIYLRNPFYVLFFLLFFSSSAAVAQEKLQLFSPVQSSTDYGGSAARAIDGNTNGVWARRSVTHTEFELQPWWSANLQESSDISKIVIWNRTDSCCVSRLRNFNVYLSDRPFPANASTRELNDDNANVEEFYVTVPSGSSHTITINKKAKYVRVQLTGRNALSLAEVEVFGTASGNSGGNNNGAELKLSASSQSSTAFSGGAGRAIDGNTNGIWRGRSVTHTSNEFEPWWTARLPSNSDITSIQLWNRTDGCCTTRLSDFFVFVSEQPFDTNASVAQLANNSNIDSFQIAGRLSGPNITIPVNATGRYIRVQLNKKDALSLAEVKVFGTASTGPSNPTPPPTSSETFTKSSFTNSYVRSFEIPDLRAAFDGKGFALDPDGQHFYTTKQPTNGGPNRNSTVVRYNLPTAGGAATPDSSVNLEGRFQNGGEFAGRQPIWGFDTGGLIEDLKFYNGKLVGSFQHQYDVGNRISRSHFTINNPRDLPRTTVTGLRNVAGNLGGLTGSDGTDGGFVAGHITNIPSTYSSQFGSYTHIVGAAGASGIRRTNVGPAAYGFNADTLGNVEPLMHRHLAGTNILRWIECCVRDSSGVSQINKDLQDYAIFNNTSTIKGMFFVPGTSKIAYIGSGAARNQTTNGYTLGSAVTHYGGGNRPLSNNTFANDDYRIYQGTHSVNGEYEFQIWVHDVQDLVDGRFKPEDSPDPQAFRFDFGGNNEVGGEWKLIGGVDMDWNSGLLYVLEITRNAFPHKVHVYDLRQ